MNYSVKSIRIRRLAPKQQIVRLDWAKMKKSLDLKHSVVDLAIIPNRIKSGIVARVQIVLEGESRIRRLKILKNYRGLKVKWDIPNLCKDTLDHLEQRNVPEEIASYVIWAYQRTSPDDDPGVMSMRINECLRS